MIGRNCAQAVSLPDKLFFISSTCSLNGVTFFCGWADHCHRIQKQDCLGQQCNGELIAFAKLSSGTQPLHITKERKRFLSCLRFFSCH